MLEEAWNAILDLTARFVIPDWESVIALIPLAVLVVVALWLMLTVRRFATAGPTRRGKARITPIAPADVHMPGPSWAPVLAAIGAFLVFFGLVVGGPALAVGVVALAITLLYWGREGLRDYDRVARDDTLALPAVTHAGPPPGVHMPGPSFRPIVGALGVTVLFFGLVFGGWLLLVGIVIAIMSLIGWLFDARKEYTKTVEADRTGHLENLPNPTWPGRLLAIGGVLVALALLVDNGIVPPPPSDVGGVGSAPSGEPGTPPGSGAPPSGEAPASGGPGPELPDADVTITAAGVVYTVSEVTAPGPEFSIAFDNQDPVPHDVDIREPGGQTLYDGEVFTGPEVMVYDVTDVPAGTYEFYCSIHPNMVGSLTVQ